MTGPALSRAESALTPRPTWDTGPRILTRGDVYRPIADSWLLADAFARGSRGARPKDVLDLCCGSGIQGIAAAIAGAEVVAVDVDRDAVACAEVNARINGVTINARCGNLFEPVAGLRFNAILANPPYLPTPDGGSPAGDLTCDGGADGRELIDSIIAGAAGHLTPCGSLWLVQSSLAGISKTLESLQEEGFAVEIAAEHREPLGPVSIERFEYFCERGLLEPFETHELLAVIRARRDRPFSAVPVTRNRGAQEPA